MKIAIPKARPSKRGSVAFVCDRKQCENCSFPQCVHTTDIEHAVNFENFGGLFMEKTEREFYNSKEWRAFRQKLIAERTK